MELDIESTDFDIADELSMLLDSVSAGALENNLKNAYEVIVIDEYAQAHFLAFSQKLKEVANIDLALIEFGSEEKNLRLSMIDYNQHDSVKWAICNRLF